MDTESGWVRKGVGSGLELGFWIVGWADSEMGLTRIKWEMDGWKLKYKKPEMVCPNRLKLVTRWDKLV